MDEQEQLPSWRELNRDTSPEAEAVLLKLWYETAGWRKLELMDDLNRTARALAMAGLRRRHPQATEAELRRHLADQVLGPELAAAAYPSDPSLMETSID